MEEYEKKPVVRYERVQLGERGLKMQGFVQELDYRLAGVKVDPVHSTYTDELIFKYEQVETKH